MAGVKAPDEAEVLEYGRSLSNWGRWGDEDELGTEFFEFIQYPSGVRGSGEHGFDLKLSGETERAIHLVDRVGRKEKRNVAVEDRGERVK